MKILILMLFTCLFSMATFGSIEVEKKFNFDYAQTVIEITDGDFIMLINPDDGKTVAFLPPFNKEIYVSLVKAYSALVPAVLFGCLGIERKFDMEFPSKYYQAAVDFPNILSVGISKSQMLTDDHWLLKNFIEKKGPYIMAGLLFVGFFYYFAKAGNYALRAIDTIKEYINKLRNDETYRQEIEKACLEKGYIKPDWSGLVPIP